MVFHDDPSEAKEGAGTRASRSLLTEQSQPLHESDPLLPQRPQSNGYFDDNVPIQQHNNYGFRGDVSIRPNTGETNSYEYALFGLALHELLRDLRTSNMILCSLTIVVVIVGFVGQVLFIRLVTATLSAFLGLASFLLLVVEFLYVQPVLPQVNEFIQDNFGLLYHPVGKSVYIALLLGPLCFGAGAANPLLILLGLGSLVSGTTLWSAWMLYPEFRRPYEDNDRGRMKRAIQGTSATWSYYSGSLSSWHSNRWGLGFSNNLHKVSKLKTSLS